MDSDQIKQDWNSRGYIFGAFRDPPGQVWADFVHKTDELVDKFDSILKFDKVKGFSKLTS